MHNALTHTSHINSFPKLWPTPRFHVYRVQPTYSVQLLYIDDFDVDYDVNMLLESLIQGRWSFNNCSQLAFNARQCWPGLLQYYVGLLSVGLQFLLLLRCPNTNMSVRTYISRTARPKSKKFSVHVACGLGSILLGRCWDKLRNSSFVADIIFARNDQKWAMRIRCILKVTCHRTARIWVFD